MSVINGIALPFIGACLTIPHLGEVLSKAPADESSAHGGVRLPEDELVWMLFLK